MFNWFFCEWLFQVPYCVQVISMLKVPELASVLKVSKHSFSSCPSPNSVYVCVCVCVCVCVNAHARMCDTNYLYICRYNII